MKQLLAFIFRLPQIFLTGLVRAYRLFLSPSLGSSCRFEPTCSVYALQALQQYGAIAGSGLTLYRLARCHPWCDGGLNAVPQPGEPGHSFFTRLVTPVTFIPSKKKPS